MGNIALPLGNRKRLSYYNFGEMVGKDVKVGFGCCVIKEL